MQEQENTYTPPPVTGYRKLTQGEVDLMNDIKAKGNQLGAIIDRMRKDPSNAFDQRAISIGATEAQTAIMWLVRAVARPTNF